MYQKLTRQRFGNDHCRQWAHHLTCWEFLSRKSFLEERTFKVGLLNTGRRNSMQEERYLQSLRGRPPTTGSTIEQLPQKFILMFVPKAHFQWVAPDQWLSTAGAGLYWPSDFGTPQRLFWTSLQLYSSLESFHPSYSVSSSLGVRLASWTGIMGTPTLPIPSFCHISHTGSWL